MEKRKVSEKKLLAWINSQNWIFAKTYAKTFPHEYIVIDKLSPIDKSKFRSFVRIIREYGYEKNFYSKVFIYYEIGGYKYWTMGAPVEETTVLNREPLSGCEKQSSFLK